MYMYMYVCFQLCSKLSQANVIIIADVVFDTNSDQCGQLLCMHRREEKRGNVSMFYADMWYGIRAMGYWGMEYYLLQCRNETCGMKIQRMVNWGMRYAVWGNGVWGITSWSAGMSFSQQTSI